MITHYLPRFLLKQFRGDCLLELELATGAIESRSIDNAGSGTDLWPVEIEHGMMGEYDNIAARILSQRVWGKPRIELSASERFDLSRWLVLFMPRTPMIPATFAKMREQFDANPEVVVGIFRDDPGAVIDIIRNDDPEAYQKAIAALGKDAGERRLLEEAIHGVRNRRIPFLPDVAATYRQHLADVPEVLDRAAATVARMQWTWYRTESGFCLGDDPFCRWHLPSDEPLWGIADSKAVEMTLPVSSQVTLCVTKRSGRSESPNLLYCNRKRTRQFNHRQRMSAFTKVYAPSRALLNPQSRHGFDAALPLSLTDRKLIPPGESFGGRTIRVS